MVHEKLTKSIHPVGKDNKWMTINKNEAEEIEYGKGDKKRGEQSDSSGGGGHRETYLHSRLRPHLENSSRLYLRRVDGMESIPSLTHDHVRPFLDEANPNVESGLMLYDPDPVEKEEEPKTPVETIEEEPDIADFESSVNPDDVEFIKKYRNTKFIVGIPPTKDKPKDEEQKEKPKRQVREETKKEEELFAALEEKINNICLCDMKRNKRLQVIVKEISPSGVRTIINEIPHRVPPEGTLTIIQDDDGNTTDSEYRRLKKIRGRSVEGASQESGDQQIEKQRRFGCHCARKKPKQLGDGERQIERRTCNTSDSESKSEPRTKSDFNRIIIQQPRTEDGNDYDVTRKKVRCRECRMKMIKLAAAKTDISASEETDTGMVNIFLKEASDKWNNTNGNIVEKRPSDKGGRLVRPKTAPAQVIDRDTQMSKYDNTDKNKIGVVKGKSGDDTEPSEATRDNKKTRNDNIEDGHQKTADNNNDAMDKPEKRKRDDMKNIDNDREDTYQPTSGDTDKSQILKTKRNVNQTTADNVTRNKNLEDGYQTTTDDNYDAMDRSKIEEAKMDNATKNNRISTDASKKTIEDDDNKIGKTDNADTVDKKIDKRTQEKNKQSDSDMARTNVKKEKADTSEDETRRKEDDKAESRTFCKCKTTKCLINVMHTDSTTNKKDKTDTPTSARKDRNNSSSRNESTDEELKRRKLNTVTRTNCKCDAKKQRNVNSEMQDKAGSDGATPNKKKAVQQGVKKGNVSTDEGTKRRKQENIDKTLSKMVCKCDIKKSKEKGDVKQEVERGNQKTGNENNERNNNVEGKPEPSKKGLGNVITRLYHRSPTPPTDRNSKEDGENGKDRITKELTFNRRCICESKDTNEEESKQEWTDEEANRNTRLKQKRKTRKILNNIKNGFAERNHKSDERNKAKTIAMVSDEQREDISKRWKLKCICEANDTFCQKYVKVNEDTIDDECLNLLRCVCNIKQIKAAIRKAAKALTARNMERHSAILTDALNGLENLDEDAGEPMEMLSDLLVKVVSEKGEATSTSQGVDAMETSSGKGVKFKEAVSEKYVADFDYEKYQSQQSSGRLRTDSKVGTEDVRKRNSTTQSRSFTKSDAAEQVDDRKDKSEAGTKTSSTRFMSDEGVQNSNEMSETGTTASVGQIPKRTSRYTSYDKLDRNEVGTKTSSAGVRSEVDDSTGRGTPETVTKGDEIDYGIDAGDGADIEAGRRASEISYAGAGGPNPDEETSDVPLQDGGVDSKRDFDRIEPRRSETSVSGLEEADQIGPLLETVRRPRRPQRTANCVCKRHFSVTTAALKSNRWNGNGEVKFALDDSTTVSLMVCKVCRRMEMSKQGDAHPNTFTRHVCKAISVVTCGGVIMVKGMWKGKLSVLCNGKKIV